jgi:5-methylcytosine-specific restriction endonuclease McrA
VGTHNTKEVKLFTSGIGYAYATVRITQSRLEKGLIAIPRGLSRLFPSKSGYINLYLDDSNVLLPRTFSSYDSTTRECRIGGMRDWFERRRVKTGDEIVIQVIDKDDAVYRITLEKHFVVNTQKLQRKFDSSKQEDEANTALDNLLTWANAEPHVGPLTELSRLTQTMNKSERKTVPISERRAKETVPAHLRVLYERIYNGHCQLCDFWFLKRDKSPYFEIHHIDPLLGHHPQNLVVVCGNCHNQFEHTETSLKFDKVGWLRFVRFNDRNYEVYQALIVAKLKPAQKSLFI